MATRAGLRLGLVVGLAALVSACGPRPAGPSEGEFGRTFYWKVSGSTVDVGEACTDAMGWQEELQPIAFDASSFIVYRVSRNGERGVTQSCETTEVDSCTDAPETPTFAITNSTLTHDPEPETFDVPNSECDFIADELWRMEDGGETLTLQIDYDYSLDGGASACELLEENVRAEASNGLGLVGCTVTLTVDADLLWYSEAYDRRAPPRRPRCV